MKKLLVMLVFAVLPAISYAGDANSVNLVDLGGRADFKEQILASFIGTFFGFVFAILLFFITNKMIEIRNRRILYRHLKREVEYDISLIQEWIDEIDKVLRKITAKDLNVFSYLKYSYFQRSFIQQAFISGIMYNKLNNEEISQLNTILSHCDINFEGYVNSLITQWKSSTIEQKEVLTNFEFEKDSLNRFKRELDDIIKKINH